MLAHRITEDGRRKADAGFVGAALPDLGDRFRLAVDSPEELVWARLPGCLKRSKRSEYDSVGAEDNIDVGMCLQNGAHRREAALLVDRVGRDVSYNGYTREILEAFVRDPSLKRAATAAEPATTILSVGAKPGEPYQSMPWEDNQDAIHLFGVGDYPGAKQVMLDALERRPGEAVFLYNLACAEALLGEREEAIEHLVTAAATEERFADAAQTDEDLASLRDDPRFPASRPGA